MDPLNILNKYLQNILNNLRFLKKLNKLLNQMISINNLNQTKN